MIERIRRVPTVFARLLRHPAAAAARLDRIDRRLDDLLFAQGCALVRQHRAFPSSSLRDHEFRIFSQFGEDGIVQRLVSLIDVPSRTFVEFGVEDFMESNCRFLLAHDNWRGLTIDGCADNVARTRASDLYWRHDLTALCAFVTRENIGELIRSAGFGPEVGILSIDLDGIDYHVWEALGWMRPAIMIAEYNSVFGAERAITVPYDPGFVRFERHHSNLYFGCSLAALAHLARGRGYSLVGSTSQGVNAFFVRDDLMPAELKPLGVAEAYVESRHRESRDADGRLTFVGGEDRLALIRGLPVVNVLTGETEPL